MVSVEMRHQPFALWIKDLSAPDPLTPLNLFGLLDFDPPAFLAIGVLPIILGITMWMQFKLNPAQMDPVQQQVFAIMPWMTMFIMAPYAAGLLLYWWMSNILTIAQQGWLYKRYDLRRTPTRAHPDQDVSDPTSMADPTGHRRARAQIVRRADRLFEVGAGLQFLPDPRVPEVAFAGRSNVGKSSLLNALTGRKALARASNTPGRTQELNYFDVGAPLRSAAGRHARLRLRRGAQGHGQAQMALWSTTICAGGRC